VLAAAIIGYRSPGEHGLGATTRRSHAWLRFIVPGAVLAHCFTHKLRLRAQLEHDRDPYAILEGKGAPAAAPAPIPLGTN
jgi:hypothetical protein